MPKDFTDYIIEHENLQPNQLPFRVTDDGVKYSKGKRPMREWTSMFDDTIKTPLDPKAKKAKGTENFLYTTDEKHKKPAVEEQFRRYDEGEPGISVDKAVRKFDQTGAEGKLKYLKQNGIDPKSKLGEHIMSRKDKELGDEMKRQLER